MFQNAVRDEMRSANPDLEYKEVTKQIGERWKGLSEDEKRVRRTVQKPYRPPSPS